MASSLPSSSSCDKNESTPLIEQAFDGGGGVCSSRGADSPRDINWNAATDPTGGSSSGSCANHGVVAGSGYTGAIRVAVGAAFFAGTNAAATALYRRNGSTVVSLYIIRSPFIYLANAIIVALTNHYNHKKNTSNNNNNNDAASIISNPSSSSPPPTMSAISVLLLRTGSRKASRLALIRSLLNSIKAVLLSIGFVFLTYADAFVVFKGVAVCGTLVVARRLLGTNEILAPHELACGTGVVLGILVIAPPTALAEKLGSWFGDHDDHRRQLLFVVRQSAGMIVAVVSGLMSSVSGTLVRMLSESGGPHDGRAPPAMLLSYLMVVMLVVNGVVALVAAGCFAEVSSSSPWAWTRFVWPGDAVDAALIATNCACTLGGHLATASGYSTTRAGIVAFLQLTEIPWVYLLDVLVLGEPTTKWKSLGSAVVFASAVAVAVLGKR